MKHGTVCLLSLAAALAVGSAGIARPPAANEGAAPEAAPAIRVTEGYQIELPLKVRTGRALMLRSGLRTLAIDGALGQQTIHTTDFTLFHVRAGKLLVTINGKEELKRTDTFWTSPAQSTLLLQAKGETVLLEAMTVSTK